MSRFLLRRSGLAIPWLLLAAACSDAPGGELGESQAVAAASTSFALDSVTNGFGQQLPHLVRVHDGSGSSRDVELRSEADYLNYVEAGHPVLPTAGFPATAIRPDGQPGSHAFTVRFTADVESDPAGLELVALDSQTGGERILAAHVAVRGCTVRVVLDADGDLGTHEAFPAGSAVQLRIPATLRSASGQILGTPAVAATHVGDGGGPFLVQRDGAPAAAPEAGAVGVDPESTIELQFSAAIQPASFPSSIEAGWSAALQLAQGAPGSQTPYAFTARPRSVFDLTHWSIRPAHAFHGQNPDGEAAPARSDVHVSLPAGALVDLALSQSHGDVHFSFSVGAGAAITNAPVVPESIVATRGGPQPGLSVIDLNGFGQGTGNPVSSLSFPLKGESRFPFNPNVTQNPLVRPVLNPGTTTVDGGSAGVFTLTLDVNLSSLLASEPVLADASDAHYGAALDLAFRNSPPPFVCQSGGGDVCALDGLKTKSLSLGVRFQPGFPNLVAFGFHPNPPKLTFPPLCAMPLIEGQEPSAVSATGAVNLLVAGNPFPNPAQGIPPTGLLLGRSPGPGFNGPSFAQTSAASCAPFATRQQIGQFLYVLDAARGAVVVLNSNRMTVIDQLRVTAPTSLAMSPNLDVLAVSSADTDSVTVFDIDPNSATFHRQLARIRVGNGPNGLA
ncbi:MAG: hypothetical protein AAGG01_06665, partial [Planctomycetota bacterium]